MNWNRIEVLALLQQLGLGEEEAAVWLCLVEGPKTHVAIAQATGISRTTVYRLVDALSEKSLVHELATEQGNLLEAAGVDVLGFLVERDEQALVGKRQAFEMLSKALPGPQASDEDGFYVKTYYGVAGLKQMLWNELKIRGEAVVFARTTANDLAGPAFADKFRAELVDRKIKTRALENVRDETKNVTKVGAYIEHFYEARFIAPGVLNISQELSIHDDIVSVYNWNGDMRVGMETKNAPYANFMRQVFESYWQMAEQ